MGEALKRARLIVPAVAVAAIVAVAAVVSSSGAASTHRAGASAKGTVIGVKHVQGLGSILYAGPNKLTVYMWEGDGKHAKKSKCSGECAKSWPAVTTKSKAKAVAGAKSSQLGTIKSGGVEQVTYNGYPLYYFEGDKSSQTASGQASDAFGAAWYVLSAGGQVIKKEAAGAKPMPGVGEEEEEEAEEAPNTEMEEAPPAEGGGGGAAWG